MHRKTLLLIISIFLFILIIILMYNRLFWTMARTSDDASILLQAKSVLDGNIILKGWSVPSQSGWTIDIPIQVIAMAIRGFTPSLMYNVPAVIYALIVAVSLLLVKRDFKIKDIYPNLIITFVILGIPSLLLTIFISRSPIHLGAILYFLIALFAMENVKVKPLKYIIIFTLLALAYIGDPFVLYVFIVPMGFVFIYQVYLKQNKKEALVFLGLLISVVIISKLILIVIKMLGGFYAYPDNAVFVKFEELPEKIYLTIQGIIELFGITFFGKPLISKESFESFVRLPSICLVFYYLYQTIKNFINKQYKNDIITPILSVSIAVDILAYVFSSQPLELATIRYLLPVIIFGAIIVGRSIHIKDSKKTNYSLLIGFLSIIYIAFFIPRLLGPIAPSPTADLENWLKSNNYQYGYGSFWTASIVTVETKDNIKIRPVSAGGVDGRITPFNFLSEKEWYENKSANFLVFDETNWGNVNLDTATRTFGPPFQLYKVSHFTVLVWNKDITFE